MKLARGAFAVFLLTIAIMTAGRLNVRAANYDFRFSLNATVSGTAGEYLSGQIYTLNLGSTPLARSIPAGTDISSWFSGKTTVKPAGMKVVVYEDAEAGANSIKIEFKGLVYGASQDEITMHVQIYYFDSSVYSFSEIADVTLSGGAKYNVIRNFTTPSGYGGVGYGIYFDMSQNNGNGFKLHGTKNVELTGSGRELNVVIDGCFLQTVPKGKDITSWFTGHVSAQNLTYNTSLNSQLPPGITVTIKNTVNVGDNSFTMVFSGTPTKGSKDLIAITIPAGYVTYNPGVTGDVKGDKRDALKTYNVSGHFVYDIESPDNDYKSVYILATYPDTTIHAGSVYTEEDGLIIKYQLVGTDSMGNPYTFKDIQLDHKITDYLVQNVYTGKKYEPLSTHTGMTPVITYISADGTYMEATITGKAKKNDCLSLMIGVGSGMQLLHSYSTYGQYIDFLGSEDTHLYFGQPDPQITMSKDIEITATVLDQRLNFSATEFTINLGNDTLAKSFSKGDSLAIFAYKSTSDATTSLTKPEAEWKTVSGWNGIYVRAAENTSAGSSQIKVYLDSGSATVDYYGYVYLAFPREYLTNAMAYGATGQYVQLSYPLKENRIFVNVEKYENYYAKVSYMTIEGSLHMASLLQYGSNVYGEIDTSWSSVLKSFEGGIASNKVYFTVTTLKDINVPRDYAAGESVKDLFRFSGYMGVDPWYYTNPFNRYAGETFVYNHYWQSDYYYDIRTAKPITKDNDGEESAHTFELYIDLSEFRAKQACHEKLWFAIKNGSSWEKVYTTPSSVFNIEGEWFETHDPDEYQEFLDNYAKTIGKTGTGTSGSIANTGIVYSSQSDVILYAKDASGNDVPGTYINMTTEKLVSDLAYDCYSIDGGTKWKAVTVALTDKQIASMLNKGMTLVLADKFDKKAKKPADDATVYTFSTINKRATAPKLKAEYSTYADETGSSAGQWALANSSLAVLSAEEIAKLEIGIADGKSVSSAGFGVWPAQGGLAIAELENGKSVKTTYYVRVKATEDTPASKIVKISVAGQQKAPNLKIDYKKEIVKGKANASITCNGIFLAKNMTKDAAKNAIELADYLISSASAELKVWICATAKKPASAVQTITAAKRFDASSLTLSDVVSYDTAKHTVKLAKGYEAYDATKQKWGSMPKVTASTTIQIRRKADAKGGKESESTFAASDAVYLVITWGTYDDSKGKEKTGITACEFSVTEPVAGATE